MGMRFENNIKGRRKRFVDLLFVLGIASFVFWGLFFLITEDSRSAAEFQNRNPELFAERMEGFLSLRPGDLVLEDTFQTGRSKIFTVLEVREGKVVACELGLIGMLRIVVESDAYSYEYVLQDDRDAYREAIIESLTFYYESNNSEVGKILRERLE